MDVVWLAKLYWLHSGTYQLVSMGGDVGVCGSNTGVAIPREVGDCFPLATGTFFGVA